MSFPGGSAGKESTCNVEDLGLISGLGRSPREGNGYLLQYSSLENSTDCIIHWVAKSWTWLSNRSSAGDARNVGSIPGSGRSPGEGNGTPLQYSCLENPMDRRAWRATVCGVAKSQTWLSTSFRLKQIYFFLFFREIYFGLYVSVHVSNYIFDGMIAISLV